MENKTIKILAIDDNQDNLISIKALLKDIFPDALMLMATSGAKGLELAASEEPDVILLDVIMPGMDGFEVCRKLKADKDLCDIPVVFVTAVKGDKESRIKALESGAEAFLSKPIDESELTAQIKAMLKINTANREKQNEKVRLSALVEEKTSELRKQNIQTINLLEDLKSEVETRKKIEKELRTSEEKYRTIFENVQDVFYQTDLAGTVVEISPSILHLCEYHRDEIIGCPVSMLYNKPNERGILLNAIQRDGELWDYELELKTKSGEIKIVSINARLTKNNEGKPKYIDGAIRDITERKQAEEKARKIGLHYQAIIEKAPDGIVLIDAKGNFKFVSPAAKKMFGYADSEEPVGNPAQFTHPDDLQQVISELTRIIQDPSYTATIQYRYMEKNGNWRWVESAFSNLLTDENVEAIVINFRDINDRKLAEEEVRKLQIAIENSEASIVITDSNGLIEYANSYFTTLTGYAKEEYTGVNPSVLNTGHHPKEFYTKLWDTIKSGKTWKGEFYNRKKNGEFYWENALISPVLNYKNEITHFVAIKTDITEAKKINEELLKAKEQAEQSEAIIKAALENSQAGIVIAEYPSGKLKYVNKAALLIRDKEYDEIVKDIDIDSYVASWQILHFDGTPFQANEVPLARAILYGEKNSREFIVRRDTNEDRYVWANAAPIFNLKGVQTSAIVVFLDITDRKQTEKELIRSEKELKRAQQITHIGSWYLDVATNQVAWTEELYKMYGFDPALPPPPYTEHQKLFTPESWEILSSSLSKTRDTGIPYELELKTVRIDGSNGWMWVRGETEHDIDGDTIGLWGAAQDVTERKQIEEELVKAKEHAQESDRLKSAFLANMSHEIRTPMNGILGFAELLKTPNLTGDQQQEYVRIIKKSGDRMLNIINNIVDISKIESGQMGVNSSETEINELIEFIYTFFKPETEARGINFILNKNNSSKGVFIVTDREKLYAIFTNLVKNAIKYSEKGSIEIGYSILLPGPNFAGEVPGNTTGETSELEFFVKDTGIGIPADRQEAIFDRFIQADIADKKAFQGAGLGLSISKSFVEMLGGRIWVTSIPGEGSTFYFTLPYNPLNYRKKHTANIVEPTISLQEFRKLKILIVEDDETSELLITMAVSEISNEILKVTSGSEAIEACRTNRDIDLVLMDIKMPGMDGYETTRQIRSFNKKVKIIAQTAFGLSGDREKALEAGCNDYISKPIQISVLLNLIQQQYTLQNAFIENSQD